MTLIRSGVKKIRVIDYDIVTLSSLNRHAFAMRADVGKLKVRVVKEYANKINPYVEIESIDDAFLLEYSDRYILKDNPDYVIDCIDDLDAKCALLKFCNEKKLNVISSMGASGKRDPSAIRVADFDKVIGDKLGRRLRRKFKSNVPNFKTVFAIDKNELGLTELGEHQKQNPENFRINDNERIRTLPVFASIPAMFGQALSSVVLCELAQLNVKFNTPDEEVDNIKKEEMIGNVTIKKLYEEFLAEQQKM
jgi:tRNA A37 threonylcarbamoyladenosine dehydratase